MGHVYSVRSCLKQLSSNMQLCNDIAVQTQLAVGFTCYVQLTQAEDMHPSTV